MRTNEKVIKEISVGNVNIPISAKYIGDYEIEDIKDMIDQEVVSGVSDFSFYDDGTNATTVNLQLKSGQDKKSGLYFDTVNLATGGTGETFAAGGGISITAATSSKAGVMTAADKSKLDGIATGANKYTLPTATDTTLGGVNKGYTIPYIVGSSSDTAGVWTGSCSGITSYKDGLTIIYVPQKAGSNNGTTLNINNLGAKVCHITNTSNLTTHFSAGTPILLTYVTVSGTGYWKRADYDSRSPYTSAYCTTGGSTAAKIASLTNYVLTSKTYVFISISNANTVQGAITLNINSKGAKPIYINGSASSASNYTLPAGTYIVYYDGTNYHFRTDGKLPGEILTNLNQNVISGVSDFSFYDDGTNATTVNLQLKSGQDKKSGLYFDTVNLATGGTGETFAAGGGISITAATSSKAGVMSAADKTKLDGIATGANKYTLPTATSSTLGGVKIGSNITVSSGTISLTKSNVTTALGYTPPTTNTTYSVATTSKNGLMSNIDKMKFDQPFTGLVDGKGETVTMTSSPIDPIVPINEYLNLSLRALPGVSVAFATYNSNAVVASPYLYKQAQRCALVLDKSQLSTIDYQTITWKTSAISGYGTPWSEQGEYSLIYIPSGYQSITFKHTSDYYNISAVGVHPTKYGGGYIFTGEWQEANEARTITLNNSDLYVILQAKKFDNSDIDPKLDVLSELGVSITLNRSDNNICRGFVLDDGTQVYPVFKSAQNNDFNRICYYTHLSGDAVKPQLKDILDCLAVYCHSLPYGYYKIIVQPPNNAREKYGVFDVLVSKDPSYSGCKYLDVTAMINLNSVSDMSDIPFGHIWGQINTEFDMAGAYSFQSMYSNEWVYERKKLINPYDK